MYICVCIYTYIYTPLYLIYAICRHTETTQHKRGYGLLDMDEVVQKKSNTAQKAIEIICLFFSFLLLANQG